MIWTTLYDSI